MSIHKGTGLLYFSFDRTRTFFYLLIYEPSTVIFQEVEKIHFFIFNRRLLMVFVLLKNII